MGNIHVKEVKKGSKSEVLTFEVSDILTFECVIAALCVLQPLTSVMIALSHCETKTRCPLVRESPLGWLGGLEAQ